MTKTEKYEWLKEAVRPLRPLIVEIFTASLFVNLLALSTSIFVLQVYDRVVAQSGLTTLQGLTIGMALVIVFDYAIRQARSGLLREGAMKLDMTIGSGIFDKIMCLPLRKLEQRSTAFWQSLFQDVDRVRSTLSGASAVVAADLPFAILALALIFLIAKPVSWVILAVIPLFLLLAWRSGSTSATAERLERTATLRRDSLVAEMIGARTTIKAVGGRAFLRTMWEKRHADTIAQSIERGASVDRHNALGHGLHIATIVAMTSVGAIGILEQQMTVGSLVAANMLAARVIGPLNQLVQHFRTLSAFRQSINRLDEVFSMAEDIQEHAVMLDRPAGKLVVDKAIFRYAKDDQSNAIEGVSCGFGPGGLHALVGANGCGKSTLLKLLRGVYRPLSGRVMLDDGDLAQFSESELTGWIGYVPQNCQLIAGPIKANIVMGYPDATDEDIIAATKLAGVHKDILDLPGGYASSVGENGEMLSGGMRQRLSIARAFVGDRPMLLMDEPTSDLDPDAEQELVAILRKFAENHTVIVATHSMVLLEACDNILVLDKGRVRGGGPAFEVLSHLQGTTSGRDFGAAVEPTAVPGSNVKKTGPKGKKS